MQRQALAHPEVAFRLLRDGKEIFHTPGDGKLLSAVYGVYGREAGTLAPVDSHWEENAVLGYVSKPTQARPSRAHQLFFVNGRPVKSKLAAVGAGGGLPESDHGGPVPGLRAASDGSG